MFKFSKYDIFCASLGLMVFAFIWWAVTPNKPEMRAAYALISSLQQEKIMVNATTELLLLIINDPASKWTEEEEKENISIIADGVNQLKKYDKRIAEVNAKMTKKYGDQWVQYLERQKENIHFKSSYELEKEFQKYD